ncbi:hypothetical protein B0187_01845 [Haemophilus paracuniculus]|uniref:DUF535 domain-containing protein n=1 Tax=Haemophilus paracuniculus TaxID=734 RepID=A0A1T0AVD8_9PAST|nr:DUF535 family protein [Haemophilus paracuniculus]OOS00253.1 hypothetical protein B0187_01845 [Haemophilus paracuniculus]
MDQQFTFPTFNQFLHNEKRKIKVLREYIRYQYRKRWCCTQCDQLVNYLEKHRHWKLLFRQDYFRLNALLNIYCDKSFNKKRRLEAIINNFDTMEKLFSTPLCLKLLNNEEIVLSTLTDDLRLCLTINDIDPTEGFWAINLKDNENRIIYNATFSFLNTKQLLISSIQGSKEENAVTLMKTVTKKMHGIRPMFMLVIAAKQISQLFDLELFGIPHSNQAKYRWNDRSKLLFNYDKFWEENNATLNDNYWHIPTDLQLKSLEEIASNKRSMYRKRYAMLEKLQQDIQDCFPHIAVNRMG